jgi:hypothetical protein
VKFLVKKLHCEVSESETFMGTLKITRNYATKKEPDFWKVEAARWENA